jgi:hypothetical protein
MTHDPAMIERKPDLFRLPGAVHAEARSHASAPATSHEAAARVTAKLTNLQLWALIQLHLAGESGVTAKELAAQYHKVMSGLLKWVSDSEARNTMAPRLTELATGFYPPLIRMNGERREKCGVYVCTDAGRKAVA